MKVLTTDPERVLAIAVVVEASAPKAYPRVALARASTLSGSVVRTFMGGEGLPEMFYLVASSLGHLRSQCSIICCSSLQSGPNEQTGNRRDAVLLALLRAGRTPLLKAFTNLLAPSADPLCCCCHLGIAP